MKIVFLCGFLEPGKCGVGDYTRRLAAELIRQGHETAIVALNDKFIKNKFVGFQLLESINVPILRLPSSSSALERFKGAKIYIDEFNPKWLSFQFVLFSFNEKGLPFGLSNRMYELGKNRQWHIMFHELWLGMEKEAKLKFILWGTVQRILITTILRKLKPNVVHTQSQLYQVALAILKVKGEFLPLISNIPVTAKKIEPSYKQLSLVIFGSIYEDAPITEFAKEAGAFAKKHGVEIRLVSIGRNRRASRAWIKVCQSEGLIVESLGEQPAERISEVLGSASFGISTTPFILAEKSGTVIAMREHGLPVICISRPYGIKRKIKLKFLPGIMEYVLGNLESCLTSQRYFPPINNSVEQVSTEFIQSLASTK